MLRRLVLILLLAILPVQWTWAAAASVCQHESIAAGETPHFGHHEHQHHDDGAGVDIDGPGVDTDCPSCHFAAPALLTPQAEAQPPLPAAAAATPYRRSVTAGLPERLIRPPHAFPVA